jgi:hypothetical protein
MKLDSNRRDAAVGLLGGLFSGLLGIGGGTVMVPLLVLWGGRSQRDSHAISLAAIIPVSLAALVIYGAAGKIDVPAAAALTCGSVLGARMGTGLLARAPERTLKAAFGTFMLVTAAIVALKG